MIQINLRSFLTMERLILKACKDAEIEQQREIEIARNV